ncbi:phage tail tape measure protein [Halomonas sp. MC140]|nr:phage tail tape measure protein [Halomonas sp. MC140]MDN7131766.1 phage tail tape measure protein [Halomonas sp. MC140]
MNERASAAHQQKAGASVARNLKLEVVLNAVDRATRPLRAIDRASSSTSQALRENRDRLKQLQSTQKNVNSFRTLTRQSTDTTTALREQQERIRRLSQQLRTHEGDSASLRAERAKAITQARTLTRRADEERQKLQRLRSALKENGFSTAELARDQRRLTTDMRQATQSVEEQQRRLKRLAEQQRNAARARGQYDRTMSMRNSMAGTGAGMVASGGAALYAGARLLTPGVAWAEQMSTLQAVGRFTADDERYQALRQQSRELGGSTAFSATEVGGGQEFLLRAGMSSEAIRASMRDVLDLALANNTELSRAADIASNIAGAFKIDMEADGSMSRVADILSGTASRANVNLEMLGETMKYLGGAEDLKLTMEQAAAMSGILGNIGVQGSQAGTTMRAMMNRLTNPAAKGAAAIANIGLQISDANGNMHAMPEILRDISQATADLGNVERKALMQDIFGVEAGSGMSELVNAMGSGQLDDIISALGDNMGENARMASTMADNIGGDLKNLRSAWEEVGISITDTNNGPLRELIQNVTTITRGVGSWINENPELASTIAKVAAMLAVLVTAGGALTLMLASILGPIALVRYGMALVGPQILMAGKGLLWLGGVFRTVGMFFLANPIGIAIASIAGAAYLIYRYWEPIKAFFSGLWQQVQNAFNIGISGVAKLLMNWSPLGLLYRGFTIALSALGIEIPERFTTLGGAIIEGLLVGLRNALASVRQVITELASGIANWFKEILGINSPSRVFERFGINIVEGMINGISSMIGALRDHVTGLAGNIAGWMGDAVGNAVNVGRDIANGLGDGIKNGASSAWNAVRNLTRGTEDTARDDLDTHSPSRVFHRIGIDVVNGLGEGISRNADGPIAQVRHLTDRLRNTAAGLMLGAAIAPPAMALQVEHPQLPTLGMLAAPRIETPHLPELPSILASTDTSRLSKHMAVEVGAEPIKFDNRPPLAASSVQASGGFTMGDININVTPAPGMNEQQLAQYVAQEVQRAIASAQRDAQARQRSSMRDLD